MVIVKPACANVLQLNFIMGYYLNLESRTYVWPSSTSQTSYCLGLNCYSTLLRQKWSKMMWRHSSTELGFIRHGSRINVSRHWKQILFARLPASMYELGIYRAVPLNDSRLCHCSCPSRFINPYLISIICPGRLLRHDLISYHGYLEQ